METPKEILVGSGLEGLKTHHGYRVLIDEIIYPLYKDALLVLEEREDKDARAMVKAIKIIIEKIDDSINFGKQASEEFKQKLNQHKGPVE